ncbi:MAG: PSD1 domain-containing protein [Planctomycetales bacterium]|nr:PSD1 domain-containing protein [Planctomycetales bacterium]
MAIDYESQVKPLLKQRCSSCHGAFKQESGLRLDAAKLIPSAIHEELLDRLTTLDSTRRMPPEGEPLSEDQIKTVSAWIKQGAPGPEHESVLSSPSEHWAFQPLRMVRTPESDHANPIDAFVFGELPASASASPTALMRRVYLEMLGMPPTLRQQEQFNSRSWNDTLDQVLSNPDYGQRWARHWLDVVRYADTNGYERDAEKPFVWRYRDYVIDAFNDDKPFDRFVMEQVAGDELTDATLESHVATGFLRLGHWDDEPADPLTDRFDQLDDIVNTTSQAFLGLTLGCARCHDHKFEPLTQQDYYGLVDVFAPLERPREGRKELTVKIDGVEVYSWHEPNTTVPATHILVRGSPLRPAKPVAPAVPAILVSKQPEFPTAGKTTTRRRLGLAQWLVQHPLTARVIVNRIWQYHFGIGLVETSNDFGLSGSPPRHQKLLDWLAYWFVHDANWSIKKLHRLILTSQAWQAAKGPETLVQYRRLEVEAIRDSMLAVSGALNSECAGPPMRPSIPLAAVEANTDRASVWAPSSLDQASRRSIYAFIKRGLVIPMFETLDLADTVSSCSQRQITTVAPQALTLFNGEFTQQQAIYFADRLRREAGNDHGSQVRLAWQLALCRLPTVAEERSSIQFLSQETLEQLCRVIFNLNEFVYSE